MIKINLKIKLITIRMNKLIKISYNNSEKNALNGIFFHPNINFIIK